MAASSRQRGRSRRSLRRLVVGWVRATLGPGRAAVRRIRSSGHRFTRLIRRGRQPADAVPTGVATDQPAARTAERGGAARVARTKTTARHQGEAKRANGQATTSRTRERRATAGQAKPRQGKRKQDLGQHTVKELREQARQAGIEGRTSMTKDQLIKALRDRR